jgi:hypothetical protein
MLLKMRVSLDFGKVGECNGLKPSEKPLMTLSLSSD